MCRFYLWPGARLNLLTDSNVIRHIQNPILPHLKENHQKTVTLIDFDRFHIVHIVVLSPYLSYSAAYSDTWFLLPSPHKGNITHRLAIPAFLTAVEMALTAVQMELSRLVSSPVPCAFLPSSRTNLVRVSTLVSKVPLSDILLSGVRLGQEPEAVSETGDHCHKVKK